MPQVLAEYCRECHNYLQVKDCSSEHDIYGKLLQEGSNFKRCPGNLEDSGFVEKWKLNYVDRMMEGAF